MLITAMKTCTESYYLTDSFYRMKKTFYYLIALIIFVSCNTPPPQAREESSINMAYGEHKAMDVKPGYTRTVLYDTSKIAEELEEETATFYIVVADTSTDYYSLRDQMLQLHQSVRIPIDTMGRSYNPSKALITLPDDDEDEIYAGDYYPRRFPSNSLSLEYLSFYQLKASEKTIALVAGIHESPESTDSTFSVIRRFYSKAFVIPTEIYTGCIH